MIPRRLHHVWVGPRALPEAWLAAWRDMLPGWEQHVWREGDIAALGLMNRAAFDWYMAADQWNGAANVVRAEVLREYGGMYVDIDSRPLQSWEGAAWLDASVVAAFEPNVPDLPGRVANGTVGAVPGASAIATWVDMIGGLADLEPAWDTTGGTSLTAALLLHRRCCDVRVLPARVFYPRDAHGRLTPGTEEPYCDHFWATTNAAYPEAVPA